MFLDYNPAEKKVLEDIVATMNDVFAYEDPDDKMIAFPPGMEDSVRKVFKNIPIEDKSKEYWDYAAIQPVQHNAKPRNQLQIDFIKYVIEHANKKDKVAGILSPGTGKTFMACYCAIQVGARTLIIAPTSSIKQQWADTLTGMFKVDPSRVKVVHTPKDFINIKEDFVVVSQASLAVLNKRYDLEKIMKDNKFGIKVIDEVQMWFKNIINVYANCNFAHNWYLTGTFGRSGEDENKLYQHMFGDLSIFREKDKPPTLFNPRPGNIYGMKPHTITKMIWMHSGLSKKAIKAVMGSMRYSERSGKWMRYGISVNAYANLILPRDGTMTRYLSILLEVIKQAEREVTYGRTLILVPTIAASEMLLQYVRKMFPDKSVVTIHSHHNAKENLEAKAKADIMISTPQSAGTGFDAKGLSKLIVSSPFKSWILGSQIRGRLRRRDDGKDTFMWDIIDADIPQLRAWANARANVYRKESKSFKVVDM